MRSPIFDGGKITKNPEYDWDDPHLWDDLDVGEFTNLCPDDNRFNFEMGSLGIVGSATADSAPKCEPPSKFKREMEQLSAALARVSEEVRRALFIELYGPSAAFRYGLFNKMYDPVEGLERLTTRNLEKLKKRHGDKDRARSGRGGEHRARSRLASEAWSIWVAHGGDINDTKFKDYVDRLLENAGFLGPDGVKSRASTDNVVREIREAAKTRAPIFWDLWGE